MTREYLFLVAWDFFVQVPHEILVTLSSDAISAAQIPADRRAVFLALTVVDELGPLTTGNFLTPATLQTMFGLYTQETDPLGSSFSFAAVTYVCQLLLKLVQADITKLPVLGSIRKYFEEAAPSLLQTLFATVHRLTVSFRSSLLLLFSLI